MAISTSIFIRLWSGDGNWPQYCLESIRKFTSGFHEIVLCSESSERPMFEDIARHYGAKLTSYPSARRPGRKHAGKIASQISSLESDLYVSPETAFILQMDCDCVFTEPATPETFMAEGLPIMLVESYDKLKRENSPAFQWKQTTQFLMKFETFFETQRRIPAVHYREVVKEVRDHITKTYQLVPNKFREFLLSNYFPDAWWAADFNILGAYVLHSRWLTRYKVIDVELGGFPKNPIKQFWSYSKIDCADPNTGTSPLGFITSLGISPSFPNK